MYLAKCVRFQPPNTNLSCFNCVLLSGYDSSRRPMFDPRRWDGFILSNRYLAHIEIATQLKSIRNHIFFALDDKYQCLTFNDATTQIRIPLYLFIQSLVSSYILCGAISQHNRRLALNWVLVWTVSCNSIIFYVLFIFIMTRLHLPQVECLNDTLGMWILV